MLLSRNSILIPLLLSIGAIANSQNIPAADAAKHLGEKGTVCGTIAETHRANSSHGAPTFIDFEGAYPNQAFTAVIWQSDKAMVGILPNSGSVCVSGTIIEYKGKPQVELHSRRDWSVASPALSNDNHYTNIDGNIVHSPAKSLGGVPAGATAVCRDATYSFSQHRQGTCSHHGGVSHWL